MTLYPYRELTITSKVQECCGQEFAAKLAEFDYSLRYAVLIALAIWSFYNKTYIIIPTCTSDIAQPPIHPDSHSKHFSQMCSETHSRCLKHTPGRHLQAAQVSLTPAHQFLIVGDQQASEGRTGRSTSDVQVGMII